MPKKGKGFPEYPFQLGSGDRWFKDSRSQGEMSFAKKSVKTKMKKDKKNGN